ncbi:Cytochrome P450 monooxygenase [Rhizoctonia solani]|uniref:Cytochrome P450 monooxygenase n=1 Tax=Rhizoctonia solani TaxID=456999 RepID=A0A8H7I8F2_9AGAM|nr:Cytochrome P450 monooxygenase [Rhizoctonia solani]
MIYDTIKQSGTQYCTAAAALLPELGVLVTTVRIFMSSMKICYYFGAYIDSTAIRKIVYGHSSGLLKSEFYEILQSAETKDVFSARDKVVHTMKRKRIANIYSAQNVLSFEPRVKEHIRRFYIQLDNRCEQALKGKSGFNWSVQKSRAVLNICPQFAYLSFDIISDLALGVPFGMVERQKDSTPASLSTVSERNVEGVPIIRLIADGGKIALAIGPYPAWFQKLLIMAPWHKNDSDSRQNNRKIKSTGQTCWKLFEVRNPDGSPMSRKEIDSEALVTIGDGSDTTANSLSALCYYVASNSVIKSRLQKELDSALSSVEEPGKINLGSHHRARTMARDGSTALNKYFVPFSTGPRACIGRNLANMNMLLISAAFFRRYDVELAIPMPSSRQLEVADAFVRDATRCEVSLKRRF